VGPETAEDKLQTRAEWTVHMASEISRSGWDVRRITLLMMFDNLYRGWNGMAVRDYQFIWFCLDRHS